VENKGDPVGAAAYIIKPRAAAQLIKRSSAIYEPVDHYLEHYSKHGVPIHAVKPYPISIVGKDSTITDRPGRLPVRGFQKIKRSVYRLIDRKLSASPWFPK
jgi:glycosyl transferase family 25